MKMLSSTWNRIRNNRLANKTMSVLEKAVWFMFRKALKFGLPAVALIVAVAYLAITGTSRWWIMPGEEVTVRGYSHQTVGLLGWCQSIDHLELKAKTGWAKSVRVYPSAPNFQTFQPGDRLIRGWDLKFAKLADGGVSPAKALAGARFLPPPPSARPEDIPALPVDTSPEGLKAWSQALLIKSQARGERFDDLMSRVMDAFRLASPEVPDEKPAVLYQAEPTPTADGKSSASVKTIPSPPPFKRVFAQKDER